MLTKTGAKMEAGQDERGQALFKLCRHWKKSPVKARKGQTSSFILINLKRVQPGMQHLVTRPAVSAGWFTFTAHSSSSAPRSMQMPPPGEEPERALAFLRERAGVEGLLDKFKNIKGSNGHE